MMSSIRRFPDRSPSRLLSHVLLAALFSAVVAPVALADSKAAAPAVQRPPSPGAEHQPRVGHWEYEGEFGPTKWNEVDPAFKACAVGKRQSPINIETRDAEKGGLKPIQFSYNPGPAEIVNNGHTIQVNLENAGTARFDGLEYRLVQFHFHTPSEEKIDSMAQHMVAHLVHRAGDTKLAVVAVMFKLGKENKALKPVFDSLPQREGQRAKLNEFNPADILPGDPTYFAYTGSLTTPPCTEDVKWHVMQAPMVISYAQLAAFKKLYKMNARPVQPLNGRRVQVYVQP